MRASPVFAVAFRGPERPTAALPPVQPLVLAAVHGLLGTGAASVLAVLAMRALAHGAAGPLAFGIAGLLARDCADTQRD
jgi:hypothetical protein